MSKKNNVILADCESDEVKTLQDGLNDSKAWNFMAQGGLSVAGGCRCLTKELDMIAC